MFPFHALAPFSLSLSQHMIHDRKLGDVFCESVKSLDAIQKDVLLKAGPNNPLKSCKDSSRPKIDFAMLVQHILGQLGKDGVEGAKEAEAKEKQLSKSNTGKEKEIHKQKIF